MAYGMLVRPERGRVLGGVCSALAARWALDVQLVRLAFALLVLASGLGIVLYAVLWLLWPSESGGSGAGTMWEAIRGNAREVRAASASSMHDAWDAWSRSGRARAPWPRSRRWFGIGLVAAGAWLFLGSIGMFSWLGAGASIGLLAVLLGLALIKSASLAAERDRR